MKNGCLFLIAVIVGLSFYYNSYFPGTELDGKWWVAALLALGVSITLANLYGIVLAIKQKIASGKNMRDWNEGDYVAASGRLQAVRDPLVAPFSGQSAVVVEYDVKRTTTTRNSTSNSSSSTTTSYISGMLMTPCALNTKKGSVKLVGFPLLAHISAKTCDDEKDFQRAAEYLAKTTFQTRPTNPLKLMAELNAVLGDDDGDVKMDLKDTRIDLDSYNEFDEDFDSYDESELDSETAETPSAESAKIETPASNDTALEARVENIKKMLINKGYFLEETCIANGAEVSVFGTYRKSKQAVDVGSGLKNLKHSIQLGELGSVLKKNFIKSLIATVIFGAITAGGHYHVAKLLGLIQ